MDEVYDGRDVSFDLGEIVRLTDLSKDQLFTLFQASTLDRLRGAIADVAGIVLRYGAPALRGDEATFKALSELRERESGAYMLKHELSSVRPQATEAWKNRQYATYVKLMAPLKHGLELHEVKKLEYAQRKVAELK